jgi:hypothetical protein
MSRRVRGVLVCLVLVSVAASVAVHADRGPGDTHEQHTPDRTVLVSPDGTNSYVWPYTSRSKSVSGRTLALNVVVLGASDEVRRALVTGSEADWNVTDPDSAIRISPWRQTHGAVRYTYVSSDRNASGRWIDAEYQLHVGTYFGHRTHLRAYSSRSGNWTAVQAHTEYWDWFRLRHTVTGVPSGARDVEEDLRDEPFVTGVTRTYHGHRGGGSDGWWTVVGLAPALVVAGSAVRVPGTWSRRDLALPGSLLAVVLGVRGFGLTAEAAFPGVTPKLFVAIGYPILAVGPPTLVAVLAVDRPPARTAILTAVGFATALVLDTAFVGVRTVPAHLIYHRTALLAALTVVAVGTTRARRRLVVVGAVAWLCLLAAPLFGVV